MDFIEEIQAIAARIPKLLDHIATEEATKSAHVMPFIQALGYNIFDPTEVIPEYTADVGTKKGEKVDYAVVKDGEIVLLFECKWIGANLDKEHASQLFRYFSVTEARIGVLTNGVIYRFYSDLVQPNKMDAKPFLEFNMLNIQEPLVTELKKLSKGAFDLTEIISSAAELKYTKEIKKILADQLVTPSDDFIKLFAYQVYSGKITQSVREQFNEIVKRAFNQFISEKINERLKSALAQENAESKADKDESVSEKKEQEANSEHHVETTEEEIEGYHIVKAILRSKIDPSRIAHRDTLSYMGILLDDNNRKPICRLLLNADKKNIVIYNENRKEEKVQINDLNEIYSYEKKLFSVLKFYEEL